MTQSSRKGGESALRSQRTLFIIVYSHIEGYPPSLNALHYLANEFDQVIVLVSNILESKWPYPGNVKLIPFGDYLHVSESIRKSTFKKVIFFIRFGLAIRKLTASFNPSLVLAYDPSSFALLRLFTGKILDKRKIPVWYHNHDVADERELPKYSLMWLGRKLEMRYFPSISFFSLPNSVRLKYFPIHLLKRKPVILPNYPAKALYGRHYVPGKSIDDTIRLIFQGHISESNGIEVFVRLLVHRVDGKNLELHLAGPISEAFRNKIERLAEELQVSSLIRYHGVVPYVNLPKITASCHIGIAVYGHHNTMVRTMSTASNKIFEYASLGLPVLMNKREDMESEFSKHKWAKFAELTEMSILGVINAFQRDYTDLSATARREFEGSLNFEEAFTPFLEDVSAAATQNSEDRASSVFGRQ